MPTAGDWQSAFARELENAQVARLSGNEGKARVCARRAAGMVAGEYLRSQEAFRDSWSSYQRLQALKKRSGLPVRVLEIVDHLTTHVDTEHKLPIQADLIAEAQELYQILFY